MVARPSSETGDPLPKAMRETGAAVADDRISYLSESAYREKTTTARPHMREAFGVEYILQKGELFVRRRDFDDKDLEAWKQQLLVWNPKYSAKGETMMLHQRNAALVLPDKPFAGHLQDWVHNARINTVTRLTAAAGSAR